MFVPQSNIITFFKFKFRLIQRFSEEIKISKNPYVHAKLSLYLHFMLQNYSFE